MYGSSRDLVTVATYADQMQAPDDASPDWSRHASAALGAGTCSAVSVSDGAASAYAAASSAVMNSATGLCADIRPTRSLAAGRGVCACMRVRGCECELVCVFGYAGVGWKVHACDCARVHTRVQGRGAVALHVAALKGPAQYLRKSGNRGRLSRPFQTHRATVQHERFHVVCCMLRRPRAWCMPRIACCLLQVASRCCSSAAHCIVVYAHLSSCAKGTSKILRHNFATFAGSSCDTCRSTAT